MFNKRNYNTMKAKRFLYALLTATMLTAATGLTTACSSSDDNPETPPPSDNLPAVAAKVQGAEKLLTKTDYSLTDNWLAKPATADKAVDVFYLYPTAYNTTDAAQDRVCDIDDATGRYVKTTDYKNKFADKTT